MGNGLRPDVWDEFKNRFDVPRICEMYGASEGNTSFLNLLNKDKTIGAAISKVALVQYDNETDEIARNRSGRCIEVPLGEPGLLLGQINAKARFDGYTNPDATETNTTNLSTAQATRSGGERRTSQPTRWLKFSMRTPRSIWPMCTELKFREQRGAREWWLLNWMKALSWISKNFRR